MNTLRSVGTLLLTLAAAVPVIAQTVTIQRDDATSVAGARGIVVADLNRDGWLDIATANHGPDGVAVLYNRGAAGGYTSTFIPIAGGPFDIAAADLNHDGIPDLAVANPDANEINVLFGQASGGFGAPLHIGAMFNPRGLALGDIDKDGNVDIVYTLYYNQGVVVLYGDGTGNFAMRNGPGTVGVNPQGVAIADFNMDGWPDLAVASSGSVGLTIMYQTPGGSGTFARQDLNVPTQQNVVVVSDFNRDGRPDIAAASTATSAVTVFINGNGYTSTLVYPSGGGSPRGIAAVDLNRDGAPDIVTGNRGTSTIDVLPGNGDGTFGTAYGFAAGAGSRTVAVGDFNNDGRVDIASANEYAASATVLSNTTAFPRSAYAFGYQLIGPEYHGYSDVSAGVADFDGDGKLDVVTRASGPGATVLLGNGGSTPLPTLMNGPVGITAAKVNGDGFDDVVLLDSAAGTSNDRTRIEVYLGDGTAHFPQQKSTQTSLIAFRMVLGDLNGDGRIDAVISGATDWFTSGTQRIEVWLGNGDGTFALATSIPVAQASWVVLGDVDRDGDVDIVSAFGSNSSGGQTALLTWLNDGKGHFASTPQSNAIPGWDGVYGADLADINHDGWIDCVAAGLPTWGSSTPAIAILLGGPSGFSAPTFLAVPDYFSGVPHIADITLDGHPDIVTEAGDIYAGNGDGTFNTPDRFEFFAPAMLILDFNHDGLPDIVSGNANGNAQAILNQRRDTNLAPTVDAGQDFSMNYEYQYNEDGDLEIWPVASDPDLHKLSYRWTDQNGRVMRDWSTYPGFSTPLQAPGKYEYAVEVADGRGGSARDTIVMTILPEKEIVLWVGGVYAYGSKWGTVQDATAASGQALHDRNDGDPKVTTPSASPASYVDYWFPADPTQTYKLWVRLKADGDYWANDSLWLQFSGAVDANGNSYEPGTTSGVAVNLEECSGCGDSGWGWRDEAWGQRDIVGTLTLRFPQGGLQRVRVQTREDGVSIDQLVLSAEKYLTTRPGSVKNDGTILTRLWW